MKATRKKPKKVSEAYLERAAVHYLGRFASTRANLCRVLEQKVRRRHEDHAGPSAEERGWIEAVAGKCERLELINDEAYARDKARSRHRAGWSLRRIRGYLFSKGTPQDAVAAAIDTLIKAHGGGEVDPDIAAAAACTRKRRIGPYRALRTRQDRSDDPLEIHKKDLASLARAGFSYAVAARILACKSPEDVELLIVKNID